ncbi:MAG TPA: Ni/Fe hydrogenase subunit alpha [Candidatus Aquicultor sp.]|jgi:NAD-reducing hydrogenase large subunit
MDPIIIDPVTRIEGHARVTIQLDDEGRATNAHFHITQLRGFEKFCEGRPFTEMPSLMARICGICPVSHLLASAKACDQILAVTIPETAVKLRQLLNYAQIVQSHALSFFYLSSPDLLLGMDADPAKRNVFGVIQQHPERAKDGVHLRKLGQDIIERLAGKRIHPSWVVPGGVNAPLDKENREEILAMMPEAKLVMQRTLDWFKPTLEAHREEIRVFANFPTLFAGLVDEHGSPDHYSGRLRIIDSTGMIIADELDPVKYDDYISEATETWSYTKFPAYKLAGHPDAPYRVGPLARLNVASAMDTPAAGQEWAEFRDLERGAVLSSFYYHYARLIEILFALEKIEELLSDPDILSPRVRAFAGPNNLEGVGVIEAPRGILVHHYKIDDEGLITWANMIVATGHNNTAMNQGILQAARHYIQGPNVSEGVLNRIEAVIRAFDPCLSCSTHAVGQMPMVLDVVDSTGERVGGVERN